MKNRTLAVLLITDFKGRIVHRDGFIVQLLPHESRTCSLTKTVAYEEAEYGITANMVCPGDIIGEMKEATIQEARQLKEHNTPIGDRNR